MKIKLNIIKDIIINLFAAALCTASLNLIVYPLYAKRYTADEYGNILTPIGVVNLLWAVFGNCLNNTRLVLNKNQNVNNESGTYNPLMIIIGFTGSVIGGIIVFLMGYKSIISIALFCATAGVGILRAYLIVIYRLKLDYKSQMITNAIVSCGYIFGVLIISKYEFWPVPILLGEFIALLYVSYTTSLIKEPFCFSENKKVVFSTFSSLVGASLIGNILSYFDRFMINPMLGAASVSVFSVASFWGKSISPFISPIANVMLSYLCQKDAKISMKRFKLIFVLSIIPLALFALLGVIIAPTITGLLYPKLINDAIPYINIASIGSLIAASTNLLMPLLLSVVSSKKILILQVIHFIIYLIIALVCTKLAGLMGFCVATCIISTIKVILYYMFGYHVIKNNSK